MPSRLRRRPFWLPRDAGDTTAKQVRRRRADESDNIDSSRGWEAGRQGRQAGRQAGAGKLAAPDSPRGETNGGLPWIRDCAGWRASAEETERSNGRNRASNLAPERPAVTAS